MAWKFNPLIACHELLESGGQIAARIYQFDKPDCLRPYRARSLVSGLYFSERRLEALMRRGKEWVSNRRDFSAEPERARYIERRKAEIERFVRARVAGH